MKYLLPIELEDETKCCGCPCRTEWGNCQAITPGWPGGVEIIDNIRPDDCPLKKFPQRNPQDNSDLDKVKNPEVKGFYRGYNVGWNLLLEWLDTE